MTTNTDVPFNAILIVVGSALVWCIAMAFHAPDIGAPTIEHIQWLIATGFIGSVIVFGMTWIVYKVFGL